MFFNAHLELAFFHLLLGVAARMRQPIFPCTFVFRYRDQWTIAAPASLPFILSDIDRDAIEIGCYQSFAAEIWQRAIESQKYLLCQIVDMFAAACQAKQGAKDHGLMVLHNLLEAKVGTHRGS